MTIKEADQVIVAAPDVDNPRIQQALDAVERAMLEVVDSDVDVLGDASRHILGAGGKRIRPRMLMLTYMAVGGTDLDYAAPPAAALELMHTASVVHDDINDHGVVRRGRPSVNSKWGRTFALLTGDFLFTTVYTLLAPYGDLNVIIAKAARDLVEGETLQASAVKNNNFTREIYGQIIALKTAALFRAACEMGARLNNSSEDVVEAVKQFGFNIGLAFQIVDDILDIVGDQEQLGKTSGIDIEQGRGFAAAHSGNNGQEQSDPMSSIKAKLMEGDTLQEAREQAEQLVTLGLSYLDILPDSDSKQDLVDLAYMVLNRDH